MYTVRTLRKAVITITRPLIILRQDEETERERVYQLAPPSEPLPLPTNSSRWVGEEGRGREEGEAKVQVRAATSSSSSAPRIWVGVAPPCLPPSPLREEDLFRPRPKEKKRLKANSKQRETNEAFVVERGVSKVGIADPGPNITERGCLPHVRLSILSRTSAPGGSRTAWVCI